MTEQQRCADEPDRVAPPDREAARREGSDRSKASEDPRRNLDRAIETGEENPA
jgi:hypothetical protein